MTHLYIEKYKKSIRVLHWVHSGTFVLLFLTGFVLIIPALSPLAANAWMRPVHNLTAIIFIIGPLVYLVLDPRSAGRGLKLAFRWTRDDAGWFKAAPRYYILGDEKSLPPQGYINTGQKIWWSITIIFGLLLTITGAVRLLAVVSAPPEVLHWMVLIHEASFIVTGAVCLLHIYVGVFHPLMTESWQAMTAGRISAEYARAHHGKWYEEITGGDAGKT